MMASTDSCLAAIERTFGSINLSKRKTHNSVVTASNCVAPVGQGRRGKGQGLAFCDTHFEWNWINNGWGIDDIATRSRTSTYEHKHSNSPDPELEATPLAYHHRRCQIVLKLMHVKYYNEIGQQWLDRCEHAVSSSKMTVNHRRSLYGAQVAESRWCDLPHTTHKWCTAIDTSHWNGKQWTPWHCGSILHTTRCETHLPHTPPYHHHTIILDSTHNTQYSYRSDSSWLSRCYGGKESQKYQFKYTGITVFSRVTISMRSTSQHTINHFSAASSHFLVRISFRFSRWETMAVFKLICAVIYRTTNVDLLFVVWLANCIKCTLAECNG